MNETPIAGYRSLRWAAVLYAVGLLLHTADHFRRGTDAITSEVLWLGTFGTVLAVVAIALVVVGHPRAPVVAVAVGTAKAVGVSAVHLLPHHGVFSDAFYGSSVDLWSWGAVVLEIAGAAALAVAGLVVLRSSRSLARLGT